MAEFAPPDRNDQLTIVLASASPRRQLLVQLLGWPVIVRPTAVDEDQITVRDPAANVLARAQLKSAAIQESLLPHQILVAADTTVAVDGQMLNKPADEHEAADMLARLRGRWHEVYTGMEVVDGQTGRSYSAVSNTAVLMRPYTTTEINQYIATGDPLDKAGAYAIQHPQFQPVATFDGCYLGIIGLSVCQLRQILHQIGHTPPQPTAVTEAIITAHNGYPCPL